MNAIIYEDRVDDFTPLVYLYPQYHLRSGLGTVVEHLGACCDVARIAFVARDFFQRENVSAHSPTIYLAATFIPSGRIPSVGNDIKLMNQDRVVGFIRHKPPYPATLADIADALTQQFAVCTVPLAGHAVEHDCTQQ